MKKKIYFFLSLILLISGNSFAQKSKTTSPSKSSGQSTGTPAQAKPGSMLPPSKGSSKEVYEEFLRNHPFSAPKEIKEGHDYPNLRHEHDFLMTMDPALGYPPVERLTAAKKRISESKSKQQKKSKTVGTLKSMPGSSGIPWEERGPNNVGGRTRD